MATVARLPDPPEVLTPREVAALLRRSVHTLRDWRTDGWGPPFWRSGGRVFYLRAEVLEWMIADRRKGEERRTTAASGAPG